MASVASAPSRGVRCRRGSQRGRAATAQVGSWLQDDLSTYRPLRIGFPAIARGGGGHNGGVSTAPVVVVPYDPAWPASFAALRERLAAALGRTAVAIEHVGSTAVPGLDAKAIIDLDVVVRSTSDLGAATNALASLGYGALGEQGVPGRWAFAQPPGPIAHHLYLLARDAVALWEHLAFRDALRADRQRADQYAIAKQGFALQFATNRDAYTEAKRPVVRSSLPLRVVSLVPSATETLIAWGVRPVACTRFCEQPAIRHVGGTKDPDIASIVALAPDVVVVDREENRVDDAHALRDAGIAVHAMHVDSLRTLPSELRSLAQAVSASAPVASDGFEVPSPIGPVLRAVVPIWREPWMTIGGRTYASEVLAAIGVENVWADASGYPAIDPMSRPVDVVLAPTEPYPFKDRHLSALVAAFGAPAHLVDGQDLFWWGARTPVAIARLRETVARVAAALR
jgi:GrpB-like predicted nucleotidyltransferase (UPF0157 family)